MGTGLLDLYEDVNRLVPIRDRRWVIEHIGILTAEEISRIRDLGIVLTTHTNRYLYKEGDLFRTQVGPAAEDTIVPLRRLKAAGVHVALATDNGPHRKPGHRACAAPVARRCAQGRDSRRRLPHLRRGSEGLDRAREARRSGGAVRRPDDVRRGADPRHHRRDDDRRRSHRARPPPVDGVRGPTGAPAARTVSDRHPRSRGTSRPEGGRGRR